MADFLAGPITDPLPQRITPASVTLTDAANVAIDLSLGDVFYLAITDNRTLSAPTNAKGGQRFTLVVKQAPAGGKTLSFNAAYVGVSSAAVSAVADSITVLHFVTLVDGSTITHKCVGTGSCAGVVTIANGASSATVSVGTPLNGKPVLLTVNNPGTAGFAAGMFALIGDVATGTLTIKMINPSTGAGVNASVDLRVAFYIAG